MYNSDAASGFSQLQSAPFVIFLPSSLYSQQAQVEIEIEAAPEGDQTGCPTLESCGVPFRRCTRHERRSSTNSPGALFPVYRSPQSSCIAHHHPCHRISLLVSLQGSAAMKLERWLPNCGSTEKVYCCAQSSCTRPPIMVNISVQIGVGQDRFSADTCHSPIPTHEFIMDHDETQRALKSATSASMVWFCRDVSFSTCGPVVLCHCSIPDFGEAESHGIHATPHVAIGGRSHGVKQFEVQPIPATLQAPARTWAQRPSPPWLHHCCPRRWQLPGSCLPTRASQPPLAPAVTTCQP